MSQSVYNHTVIDDKPYTYILIDLRLPCLMPIL